MNRTTAYLLGPELLWALMLAAAFGLVALNRPPTELGSARLEKMLWLLPPAGVLLSFVPFAWTPGSVWWLLLRIAISGGIGLIAVVLALCGGIDYGDSRNSGVLAGFMLSVGLGCIVLFVSLAIAAVWIFVKGHAVR